MSGKKDGGKDCRDDGGSEGHHPQGPPIESNDNSQGPSSGLDDDDSANTTDRVTSRAACDLESLVSKKFSESLKVEREMEQYSSGSPTKAEESGTQSVVDENVRTDALSRFAASQQTDLNARISRKMDGNPNVEPTRASTVRTYLDHLIARKNGDLSSISSVTARNKSDTSQGDGVAVSPASAKTSRSVVGSLSPRSDRECLASLPGAISVSGVDGSNSESLGSDNNDETSLARIHEHGDTDVETGNANEADGRGNESDHPVTLVEAELVVPGEAHQKVFQAQEVKIETSQWSLSTRICIFITVVVALLLGLLLPFKVSKKETVPAPTSSPTFPPNSNWIPLGQTIVGEDANDSFGVTLELSFDGKVLAVGAPRNSGDAGLFSGHVRVHKFDEDAREWRQLGQDLDGFEIGTHAAAGTALGISSDGKTVAFASPTANNKFGRAVVYRWDDVSAKWLQRGSYIDGLMEDYLQGGSLSLSKDGLVLALGAENKNGNGSLLSPGQVRVFAWNSTLNDWVQRGKALDARKNFEGFGWALSLSSDGATLAVGAPLGGDGNMDEAAGETRIYSWNSTAWVQLGADIYGSSPFDKTLSLSADGTTVAILTHHINAKEDGYIQVLSWDDTTRTWTPKGKRLDDSVDHPSYSISLSADGNRIARATDHSSFGEAMVHEWANGAWELKGRTLVGEREDEAFGHTVALSGDGNILAVSAPKANINGDKVRNAVGRVEVFEWPRDEE